MKHAGSSLNSRKALRHSTSPRTRVDRLLLQHGPRQLDRRCGAPPPPARAAAGETPGGPAAVPAAGPPAPPQRPPNSSGSDSESGGSGRGGAGGGGGGVADYEQRYHPVSLAYLGDAVWEMYMRRSAYVPPKRHAAYLAAVRPHVSAEGQAAYHDWLLASGLLTQHEAALLRWAGRKQDVRMRTRFSRTASEGTYRKATALEALVGYLHLTDPQRLTALAGHLLSSGAVPGGGGGGGGGESAAASDGEG